MVGTLSRCSVAHNSLEAYATDFVALGWKSTSRGSPDYIRAARAAGEYIWATRALPEAFESEKEATEFLAKAHEYGENYAANAGAWLFAQDDYSLYVSLDGLSSDRDLKCYMIAPHIPEVSKIFNELGDDPKNTTAFDSYGLSPLDTPYVFLGLTAMSFRFDERPETLIGGDTMAVSLSFKRSDATD